MLLLLLLCMKWQQRGGKKKKIKSLRLSIKTFGGRLLSLLPIRERISFNFLENFVLDIFSYRAQQQQQKGRKKFKRDWVILQCHTNVTVQFKKKNPWRRDVRWTFLSFPLDTFLGFFCLFPFEIVFLVFFNLLGSQFSFVFWLFCRFSASTAVTSTRPSCPPSTGDATGSCRYVSKEKKKQEAKKDFFPKWNFLFCQLSPGSNEFLSLFVYRFDRIPTLCWSTIWTFPTRTTPSSWWWPASRSGPSARNGAKTSSSPSWDPCVRSWRRILPALFIFT